MDHYKLRLKPFLCTLLVLAGAGCSDSIGPGEPEDRGVRIVANAGFVPEDLVWTTTGAELVYVAFADNGFNSVNAVSVTAPHTVRPLDGSTSTVPLSLWGAGERIYFGSAIVSPASFNDPTFRISRIDPASGGPELLFTTFQSQRDYVAVSDDERFLVSSNHLYDLQSGGGYDLPGGTPVGFSPDGTQLLYYVNQPSTSIPLPTLVATADGSARSLHSTDDFYVTHRWQGNSPQLLRADHDLQGRLTVSEMDGLTGVTQILAQFTSTYWGFGLTAANWSPSGAKLGVWIDEGSRTKLYVIRAGGEPAVAASTAGIPTRPVFSPDGNSVAYFNYESTQRALYVKSGI